MAIKDARKERPPTAYAPLIGREYRLLCPLPYQAPTTTSTTSPRYSGEFFTNLKTSAISTSGLFLNADTGFDSAKFRRTCLECEVFLNVASNPKRERKEDDVFFDELLYGQTYCIERTNAWMDSCRSLLNRFDTKLNS